MTTARFVAGAGVAALLTLTACVPEQRPTPGTVRTIGTPPASTESVSAVGPEEAPNLSASPSASPSPVAAVIPSKADGIYTPTTNREIYQLIASDVQEIALLANQVNDGKPLPSAEILKIYEESKLARAGTQTRLLRNFAREEARATEFPDEAAFFGSKTFLEPTAHVGLAISFRIDKR